LLLARAKKNGLSRDVRRMHFWTILGTLISHHRPSPFVRRVGFCEHGEPSLLLVRFYWPRNSEEWSEVIVRLDRSATVHFGKSEHY
jgi:hypothetical protein